MPTTPPRRLLAGSVNPALRATRCGPLGPAGFEVTWIAYGRAALVALHTGERPGIIIVELMLPVVDGWAFFRQQLADPLAADILVIILCTVGEMEDPSRRLRAMAYYPLPVDVPHLVRTLQSLFDDDGAMPRQPTTS